MVNGQWQDKCMYDRLQNSFICSIETNYTDKFALCEEACPLVARRITARDPSAVHPMCLDPKPNVTAYFPDNTQIQSILDVHNALRSMVGITYRGSNIKNPVAANLGKLKWDYDLARLAQRWADNFVFEHNKFNRLLNHPLQGITQFTNTKV